MSSTESLSASWSLVLSHLHQVGLLRALRAADAVLLLGPDADGPPHPLAIADLIRAHYAADGDWVEALWRRQSDRVVHVDAARTDPSEVAAQVAHALPDLEPLRVNVTKDAMTVVSNGDRVALSRLVRHARIPARSRRTADVSAHAVVRGANVLLSRRDHPLRFVPLRASGTQALFVAASERSAFMIARLGICGVAAAALPAFTAFEPSFVTSAAS